MPNTWQGNLLGGVGGWDFLGFRFQSVLSCPLSPSGQKPITPFNSTMSAPDLHRLYKVFNKRCFCFENYSFGNPKLEKLF